MQFIKNSKLSTLDILKWVGIITIALGISASLLISPPNVEFTRKYYEFGLNQILFLILIFTALFSISSDLGKSLSLLFTLSLFNIPLLYKWQTADYYFTLGGLLPLSDTNAYFQGAQNIIYGFSLSATAAYRPIFPAFLATVMKAVNSNLQLTLIVLVIINAFATYLASREIQRTLKSSFAAALYLILGFMFYRRFGGTLLTENLGFCLGNLALIFLLRGSAQKNIGTILFGLFILTTGLNARAGAFLILPVLAIWLGISFRGTQNFWRVFLFGFLSIALGMAANWVLVKFINSSSSSAFSNYSYTLYGLASGNKGWEQAGIDFPNASTSEVYDLAFQKIRENPALFVEGIIGAYKDYFVASKGAFSFLLMKHDRNDVANFALWVLSVAGLGLAIINRGQLAYSISLAFFIGILLSVGLAPPADSSMMRAYATTIPMSCYLVVVGIGLPRHFLSRNPKPLDELGNTDLLAPLSFSILILAASLVAPIFISLAGQPPEPVSQFSCSPGKDNAIIVISNGSSITLKDESINSFVPDLEIFRFFGKLVHPEQQLADFQKAAILEFEPGTTVTVSNLMLINSTDQAPGSSSFLLTKGSPKPGTYHLCVDSPYLDSFFFLSPDQYETNPIHPLPTLLIQALKGLQLITIGVAIVLIFIKMLMLERTPPGKRILTAINSVIILSGFALLLHMSGLVPLAWEEVKLESKKIQHRDGFLYAYNIGDDSFSDTKYQDFPSYLYENDTLMFQPHESQSMVANLGRGSYILKEKFLFFSTTDNSDPETNGREYTLKYPLRVRLRYQIIVFSAAFISLLLHFLYIKPLFQKSNPDYHHETTTNI